MNNPIKVRKRVPAVLVPVLNRKEFKVTFNTQAEAELFELQLNEAVTIMNSHSIPDTLKVSTILSGSMKQYYIPPTKEHIKATSLTDITTLYLAYSKENVTNMEYYNRVYFFNTLLPALFKRYKLPTDNIQQLKPTDMEVLRNALLTLPSKKFTKYRDIPIDELVKIEPPVNERQGLETVNKLIQRIKSLALYGVKTGLYSMPTNISTYKVPHKTKGHREPFTAEEYPKLKEAVSNKAELLLDIVYYSGMRPSEITKCEIKSIDGVLCFDLTNPKERLKTKSSYRLIPVHPNLMPYIEDIKTLTYTTIKSLSKHISKHSNKPLYSARHSFITNLLRNSIPLERVQQLCGHSNGTITMGVYFGGYEIPQLYKDICTIQ
jgi:integrase